MAEVETLTAGALSGDVIGKVIRVRVDGLTIVEDTVINVEHSMGVEDCRVVYIAFENIVGRKRLANSVASSSFIVDQDELVQVFP